MMASPMNTDVGSAAMSEPVDYLKGLLFLGWGLLWSPMLHYAVGKMNTSRGAWILSQIGYARHPLNDWVGTTDKKGAYK